MPKTVFIVGVQKAGTTALHSLLSSHPDIAMSPKKELHFFDDETRDWTVPSYSNLENQFGQTNETYKGEATPIYSFWPRSIQRLEAYDPSAKLILILRHPVFRAHSHWRMEIKRGADHLSFSQAIRRGRERISDPSSKAMRVFSYVERGFYAKQVETLLKYFPKSNLHFLTTDQLWLSPEENIRNIEDFLGLRHAITPDRNYVIKASTDVVDELGKCDRAYLMSLYRADILKTAQMTGMDLVPWTREEYQEPAKR